MPKPPAVHLPTFDPSRFQIARPATGAALHLANHCGPKWTGANFGPGAGYTCDGGASHIGQTSNRQAKPTWRLRIGHGSHVVLMRTSHAVEAPEDTVWPSCSRRRAAEPLVGDDIEGDGK